MLLSLLLLFLRSGGTDCDPEVFDAVEDYSLFLLPASSSLRSLTGRGFPVRQDCTYSEGSHSVLGLVLVLVFVFSLD